jgi:CRISPR-associated protein Csd1
MNIQEAPSLKQIVECAYGIEREERGTARLVVDDRVLKQQVQRLIACRIDCTRFPVDIEQRLIQRASSPQAYDDRKLYSRVLSTACAVIKKVYFDYRREELDMALDPQKRTEAINSAGCLPLWRR